MRRSHALRYALALCATLFATAAAAQAVDIRTATLEGVTHAWAPTGLGAPAEGIVLGQPLAPQYVNSRPTMLRQDGGGNVRLQNADDAAVPATAVELLAISGDLRAIGIPAEIGALEMDHIEQEITFERPFARTPVVFTTQSTQRGSDPAYTFASYVDRERATIKLREPAPFDGWHMVETVRYLAIEPGEYMLPDGRWLSVTTADWWINNLHSARSAMPPVPLRAGATVIATMQNTPTETPAQNIAVWEGYGEQVEFADAPRNYANTAGYPLQTGYLIVGERLEPSVVTLLGSSPGPNMWQRVQTGASIEYLTEPNNTCHALADFGIEQLEQLELLGPGAGTATVALFDGPRCTGAARTLQAFDVSTARSTDDWQLHHAIQTTRSFRVVRTRAAELELPAYSTTCFAPGDVILDNGAAVLQFTAEGDLGVFKRNPANGGLVAGWLETIGADALCLNGDQWMGWGTRPARFVASRDGQEVWSSHAYSNNVQDTARLTLDENCDVALKRSEWDWLWGANSGGCHGGMPLPTLDPTPVPKLIFGDVDGDEDPEMVLMLTKADGSGSLMYDPLGIADFFYTVGLPPDADFIPALSQTQRATLRQQTQNAVPGGVTTIEQLLDLLERMHPAPQVDWLGNPVGGPSMPSLYRMFEFEVAVDVSAVEAEAEWNGFEAGASVGNFEFEMHQDADSFGYGVSASAAEVEVGYDGYVTVQASVLSAEAGMYVGDDGVAVGGGADVVAVTFTGGREDRTHIGVSAGVGVGFWAEARWGRDDLYGFTLDLPIFPVGIAIYVRGDDVKWLGERIVWLVDEGLYHGERLANVVWRESSTWAVGAYGDSAVFVTNTYNDTRAFVEKTGNGALVGLGNAYEESATWVQGAGWTLENAVHSMGDAIESGANDVAATMQQVGDDVGNWVGGAANDAGSWFEGAANDVADFFGGLF